MLARLTNPDDVENARLQISELIAAHAEWFVTQTDDNTEAVRREELDLSVSHGRVFV
jgi:hypothetical protein